MAAQAEQFKASLLAIAATLRSRAVLAAAVDAVPTTLDFLRQLGPAAAPLVVAGDEFVTAAKELFDRSDAFATAIEAFVASLKERT